MSDLRTVELPPAGFDPAAMARLLEALDAAQGATRLIGGWVRDTLRGAAPLDLDLATRLLPEAVAERARGAGLTVWTSASGLAHGTVGVVLDGRTVEVTTLRRDVSTDGRHATVAFTDDWREDAARRDFTINALSADPISGAVADYFGGIADLAAGRVRFIGDPLQRIAEDHLRILRFFRFQARFGGDRPDADALAACSARARDLMALSRERIADELLKLLAVADPGAAVALMIEHAIFLPVLPEIGAKGAARLRHLVANEAAAGFAPEGMRRLAALLPRDPARARAVAERLKLSRAAQKRLGEAVDPGNARDRPAQLAYRIGREAAMDWLLVHAPEGAAGLEAWERPRLPVGGGDLIALGLKPGPIVARTLQALERAWTAADFRDEAWVRDAAARLVDQALRDSQ